MEVLQVNIPAPISYVQSNKPGITVAINFIDSADHVVIEQVKTNDLQDRRLIVKNSEGVQIFTLVRGPKNQMNQTFVATLFNMAGEQVMCIDHKPINPFVLGCCCMCIVCSFGCCNQLVPVSDIQCPVGNSLGILKQSGGPTGPRTFATDNNGVKFSFNHGCCFQDQSEFQTTCGYIMTKFLSIFILNFISCVLLIHAIDAGLVYHAAAQTRELWKKEKNFNGCPEVTEPFNCPGTNTCISLQFICDGIPGDCPDNYDEDTYLCNAYERPPKDTIMKFLSVEYNNHGAPFIVYLFGNNAAAMFKTIPPEDAFAHIAKNLAVAKTLKDFAKNMEMSHVEKERLQLTLEKISYGELNSLPTFIKNSIGEGLGSLTENLKKTNFF